MFSFKVKRIIFKIVSLLSVIRGYNILVLIAAQYLAAIFIFSPQKSLQYVVFDLHLLCIVLASVCSVAAGYIINNFYDVKVDRINRPLKSGLDNYVKQETKLSLYFFLNFLGFAFGLIVSWKAALFFSVYIFGIWLYSHKLKKYPLTGLISATILTVLPFFAVFIHFKNFSKIIFVHAVFLFLVIMVRELIKDLENIKVGTEVSHEKFGKGKVIQLLGEAPNVKATVFFPSSGQKQLLLKFAKLQILN
jgi:4-hydroxybenzoate polyprenyltransferase